MEQKHTLRSTSSYILKTGKQGVSNLDLQNEIFKRESIAQVKKAGLAPGMVVWDVGCGGGVMTEYLAKMVGDKGIVYALDVSADQVKAAKQRIESAGYKNVRFINGDIDTLNTSHYEKADIVYARFLLMHVHNPPKTIEAMASLLKQGGRLSLQESTMGSIKETSSNLALVRYYDLIIAYGDLKKFDYNVGRQLEGFCANSGLFSKIVSYKKNYKTTQSIKDLLSARLDELEPKFLSEKLIAENTYEDLKGQVREFFRNAESNFSAVMCEQSHIIAYKSS